MSTEKERFADNLLDLAAKLIDVMDASEQFENTYFDLGFNSGGADPIIDGDVSSRLITAAEVESFITFIQQYRNFIGNTAVSQGDYAATLNALRHVGT